jgi:hypothetical protein
VPVYATETSAPVAYRTLPEAIASGEVLIDEQTTATAPMLQVINKGALPLLILDGEDVAGGRDGGYVLAREPTDSRELNGSLAAFGSFVAPIDSLRLADWCHGS